MSQITVEELVNILEPSFKYIKGLRNVRYIAQDENGALCGFTKVPNAYNNGVWSTESEYYIIGENYKTCSDWKTAIIKIETEEEKKLSAFADDLMCVIEFGGKKDEVVRKLQEFVEESKNEA